MDGYWGDMCTSCDANCADTCDKDTGYCTCMSEYYNVNKTRSECTSCYENCHSQACDPDSGVCYQGCVDGYWGDYCNQTCTKNCNGTCAQHTGYCKSCVNSSLSGLLCDQRCSLSCLMQTCEHTSGNCTKGCHNQYFGRRCEHNCSFNCVSSEKNQSRCSNVNGKCLEGCIDGFVGDFCDVHHGELHVKHFKITCRL